MKWGDTVIVNITDDGRLEILVNHRSRYISPPMLNASHRKYKADIMTYDLYPLIDFCGAHVTGLEFVPLAEETPLRVARQKIFDEPQVHFHGWHTQSGDISLSLDRRSAEVLPRLMHVNVQPEDILESRRGRQAKLLEKRRQKKVAEAKKQAEEDFKRAQLAEQNLMKRKAESENVDGAEEKRGGFKKQKSRSVGSGSQRSGEERGKAAMPIEDNPVLGYPDPPSADS